MSMRVAFILNTFPVLSESFILDQITGLLDRGHDVDIVASRATETSTVHPSFDAYGLDGRTSYIPPIPDPFSLRLLNGLALAVHQPGQSRRLLWQSLDIRKYGRQGATLRLLYTASALSASAPYDVIHCHFGPSGHMGALLRNLGAIEGTLVTTFYGYDLYQAPTLARYRNYDFLFRTGDLFVAISETMFRRLIELGCDPHKIVIHRLGVDTDKFVPSGRQLSADNPVDILSVSRLVPKKGIEHGIRAVAHLAKGGENLRYRIVGDGPLRGQLQHLIRELGVGNIVELQGWQAQPDVVNLLQRSDILLAPSVTGPDGDQEGTPVAILEAMATGLPVVSTWHGSIPDIVDDGVSGFLVGERDEGLLVERLVGLIKHPHIRASMGEAGRRKVKAWHDIVELNDELVAMYHSLIAAGKNGAGVGA